MVEGFVIYLAGHNRPPHAVLFGNDKDIAGEYERAFIGMTAVDCSLATLLDARATMRSELPQRLRTAHKQFLTGLERAAQDRHEERRGGEGGASQCGTRWGPEEK